MLKLNWRNIAQTHITHMWYSTIFYAQCVKFKTVIKPTQTSARYTSQTTNANR